MASSSGAPLLVEGEVTDVAPERQDRAPPDAGRNLLVAAAALALLSVCGIFAAVSMAVSLVLLVAGLGAGCGLPLVLSLTPLMGQFLNWIRGRQTVSILNFQVLDSSTAITMEVSLIRKRGGMGTVRLGDRVRVWGKQDRSGQVRAFVVQIYESSGHATNTCLEGDKPMSAGVGLLALGLVVAGISISLLSMMGLGGGW
jgi:hypothetical protein